MAPAVSAAPATTGQDIVPMADTVLPSSYSLVEHNENGTLPPIDDQGQIGSCVGQAVTYMQFSQRCCTVYAGDQRQQKLEA